MSTHATDFGGLVRREPAHVVRPTTALEVCAAVAAARAGGHAVATRGQGHSTRGQTLLEGGFVIDLTALAGVVEIGTDRARVLAGTLWSDVVAQAAARGLTPPVLTDFLGISVGGTLSVGGIGGQSFRHGLQIDNVLELQIVTGDGRLLRCSATEERELFDAARGGLGQFGILVEATIALRPAPNSVQVAHTKVAGVQAFVKAQTDLVDGGQFDYVLGNIVPAEATFELELECVRYVYDAIDELPPAELVALGPTRTLSMTYLAYVNRLAPLAAIMATPGDRPRHPWCDLFVSTDTAAAFLERTLQSIDPDELRSGYAMTYPVKNERLRCASPALPEATHSLLVAILPSFAPNQDPQLRAYEQKLDAVYRHARALGATVYPHSYPVGTEHLRQRADWERQLGRPWSELVALKKRFDPDHLLGRSIGVEWGP